MTQIPAAGRPASSRDERPPIAIRRNRLPWLIGALALVGVVVLVMQSSGTGSVQEELAIVQRFRKDGKLERAAATIERLRARWQGAVDDRLQRLDVEQQALDAIGAAIARLEAQVLDPAIDRSYAEWSRELQRIEGAEDATAALAARRVRGALTETLRKRPKVKVPPAPVDPVATTAPPPKEPEAPDAAAPPVPVPAPTPAAPPPDAFRASLADAERLAEQGLFAQALATLQEALARGEAADAAAETALRSGMETVRARAHAAVGTLVAEVEQHLQAGRAADAVTALAASRHRFPASGEFQTFAAAMAKAEAALAQQTARQAAPRVTAAADDEAETLGTLAQLRAQMDGIRAAEERGAFADAAALLREAASLARDRDAAFAGRLEARAADAELMAAFHRAVAAALQDGRTLKVTTAAGRAVTLQAVEGSGLAGTSADGAVRLSWPDVSSLGIALLVDQTRASGEAALGAAVLFFKNGDSERAEELLARVLRGEPSLKPAVDGVVSRGRGEPVDERGYTLGKDGFVSARAVELRKEAQKVVARLDAALVDRNPEARVKIRAEIAASSPDAVQVLVVALKKQLDQRIVKVEGGGLRKQVDRLAEQRAVLDAARAEAKALIYDEVRYFYPYKPPAVSADKFAEYNRVQAEVNRLVAAVRVLWKDDRTKVRVPTTLAADLERIEWLAQVLGDLGAADEQALARLAWARALPAGDSLGVRDFCVSPAERAELEEWRRIEAYNAIVGKQMSSSVRELLAITNEYRAMFRHRPLALVKAVCEAAQGHADEMTRLGYFSHMSPTPGRRTPYDRMRLAGYTAGVSENIALHDGALGAHNAWCTSSGHHRNLLDPSHTEMGIGCDGRNWVENFGAGRGYRDDPAWRQAADAASR